MNELTEAEKALAEKALNAYFEFVSPRQWATYAALREKLGLTKFWADPNLEWTLK